MAQNDQLRDKMNFNYMMDLQDIDAYRKKTSRSTHFHSNDTNVLQQQLKELEGELQGLDQEYEQLISENQVLQQENEIIKEKNKQYFELMTQGDSQEQQDLSLDQNNIGELHSLYQDLFLTDIKKEVKTAQTELKQCKQEQNSVQREIAQLKKDNQQLTAMLKRYRKTLQELTNNKKDDLNLSMMSPADLQKMHQMSLDSLDPDQIKNQQQTNIFSQEQKSKLLKRSDSGISSLTNLVSQATFIETAKIERLLAALISIQHAEKIYEILMTALKEIKILITCQNCTIFVMNPELQKSLVGIERIENIHIQKFTLDGGKYVDALCENDYELSQPGFKKPEDVRYGMKSQQFLAQPVFFKEEEIIIIIQCEAKVNKKTNKFIGFQVADEQVLKIFSYYLQMRFERRVALREVKQREKQVVDTLKLTSEICTQRHHDGLFKKMREHLPNFFGFEAVGLLIYNYTTNWLFSDPDNSKRDEMVKHATNIIEAEEEEIMKQKGLSEVEKKERILKKIKEIHQKKFMNFPCNSGITGIVFQSGQIYISNCATKETKFIDEIDNQSGCTDVKNFMIGPVYGERKDMPCGIIQFINKQKGEQITQQDENKFKIMQDLLGICIDNTNEMSLTINVTLDVHDVMKRIENIVQKEYPQLNENVKQEEDNSMEILQDHIKVIKDTYNKLMDERNKAKSQI